MNKHTKTAILIAPILAVLSFAATDMYQEHQASAKRIFVMQVQDQCDIQAKKCVLKSDQFLLSFSHADGKTIINSTYPLDTATLFIVEADNQASVHPLGMTLTPYYWRANTDLAQRLAIPGNSQKLRIIANIKGGSYIGEFTSTTQ
ncbi:MAG: hypothetical protein HRU06_20735 [Oceanospirillaceae bacterium]|nr:hypothetical protein [Oceanospirillaceae bacterium]